MRQFEINVNIGCGFYDSLTDVSRHPSIFPITIQDITVSIMWQYEYVDTAMLLGLLNKDSNHNHFKLILLLMMDFFFLSVVFCHPSMFPIIVQ